VQQNKKQKNFESTARKLIESNEQIIRKKIPTQKPFKKSSRINIQTTAKAKKNLDEINDGKKTEPLTKREKSSKKSQRNNLLRLLGRNRDSSKKQTRLHNQESLPQSPVKSLKRNEKGPEQDKEMSPLENLFNIIASKTGKENDSEKTLVKVTSSSSSSSSSRGPNVRPHGRIKGKKTKKGQRLVSSSRPVSNKHPILEDLSPQERLVKKVKDTLVKNKDNIAGGVSKENGRRPTKSDMNLSRPQSNRKKVIFRKKKLDRFGNGHNPREGRTLEGSNMKRVKVRVRRINETPTFPIVY